MVIKTIKTWISKDKTLINKNEQENIFRSLGIERNTALDNLNKTLESLNFEKYSENSGMYSEHMILFSALSLVIKDTTRILEIGTHNGMMAVVLANLFPRSIIDTIDLPSNEESFKNSYQRQDNSTEFVKKRNAMLSNSTNINFKETNSLNLCKEKDNVYDLIWIDGAHGYPVVTSDIVNAIRLIRKKGYILIDDIYIETSKSDMLYKSNAGYETLQQIKEAGCITDLKFALKRIGHKHNKKRNQKYIAIVK